MNVVQLRDVLNRMMQDDPDIAELTVCVISPERNWVTGKQQRDEIVSVSAEEGRFLRYDPVDLSLLDLAPHMDYVLIGDAPVREAAMSDDGPQGNVMGYVDDGFEPFGPDDLDGLES